MKHSCGFPLETTWQQGAFINCCRIVAILGLGLGSPGAAATPRLSRTINPGGERATSPGVSYCSLFLTEQSIPTTPPLRSALHCTMHNKLYSALHNALHNALQWSSLSRHNASSVPPRDSNRGSPRRGRADFHVYESTCSPPWSCN